MKETNNSVSQDLQDSAKALHDAVKLAGSVGVESHDYSKNEGEIYAGDTTVEHSDNGQSVGVKLNTPSTEYSGAEQTTDENGVLESIDDQGTVGVSKVGEYYAELTGSRAERATKILRKRATRNLNAASAEKITEANRQLQKISNER